MSEREFSIQPVTLEGRFVRLEPLSRDHLDGIVAAGSFEEIGAPEPPGTIRNPGPARQAPARGFAVRSKRQSPCRAPQHAADQ